MPQRLTSGGYGCARELWGTNEGGHFHNEPQRVSPLVTTTGETRGPLQRKGNIEWG
jgi:hypothetical protein